MTVLLAPIVSEKATMVADKHEQVVFRVAQDATKPEVKAAVELMFKVQVDSVQISNVRGKEKRFGRFIGRRRHWKKVERAGWPSSVSCCSTVRPQASAMRAKARRPAAAMRSGLTAAVDGPAARRGVARALIRRRVP